MDKIYFENIYLKYFKVLSLFSLRIVGDISSAEDIVQEVFTTCWASRKEIDITISIKPYLYQLTYTKSLDFLRKSENKNIHIGNEISSIDALFYSTFTQDEELHADACSKEIIKCIDLLPEKCKCVFLLSRRDNFKNKEIAERLGISIKTVEKHISTALHAIRVHLLRTGYLIALLIIYLRFYSFLLMTNI